MINFYLDLLEDAAQFEMMVYYHGCLVPRGWERTYPHLMTQEAVRGAEWYNNGPEFTATAPQHNTILPFTRNVVGPMDYTPVTFTNSQYPHTTSYGHELALSVVFESGFQHMADRSVRLLRIARPGQDIPQGSARCLGQHKIAGWLSGEGYYHRSAKRRLMVHRRAQCRTNRKNQNPGIRFLPEGVSRYKLMLIADGKHDRELVIQYAVVDDRVLLT